MKLNKTWEVAMRGKDGEWDTTTLHSYEHPSEEPLWQAEIDGSVPGYHFTTAENGLVVPRAEDWQQGVLMILHNERNHDVTPLRISDQGINIGSNYYA